MSARLIFLIVRAELKIKTSFTVANSVGLKSYRKNGPEKTIQDTSMANIMGLEIIGLILENVFGVAEIMNVSGVAKLRKKMAEGYQYIT